jgi:uncharacterized RDD family membrane protein YckC
MATNISDNKKIEFPSYFTRATGAAIDIIIVLVIRGLTMTFLALIWLNQAIYKFIQDFREKFGTEQPKSSPEHIDFIKNHEIILHFFFFYLITFLIGMIYHAYLNSSSWQGTIGKRIMGITLVKNNGFKISFFRGMLHYLLSVLPFFFLFYLIFYQYSNNVSLYQAITGSTTNIILGLVFLLWTELNLFTKNKTTIYDIICNTTIIINKPKHKWPWSKKNNA